MKALWTFVGIGTIVAAWVPYLNPQAAHDLFLSAMLTFCGVAILGNVWGRSEVG